MVIGTGVAGAAVADALARRGTNVTVLERHHAPATGASGNAAAVVRPFLAREERDPLARFYSDAARFAFDRLDPLLRSRAHAIALGKGALWVHPRAAELHPQGHRTQALDSVQTASVLGQPAPPGAWLPDAINLSPAQLCRHWLDHPRIDTRFGQEVGDVECAPDGCTVRDRTGRTLAQAGVVIVACGPALPQLLPRLLPAPTDSPGGLHRTQGLSAALRGDAGLRAALLAPQAITPTDDGVVINTGHWREPLTLPQALATLQQPPWLESLHLVTARLASRLHTPDRLPLVGAVPDIDASLNGFEHLRRGEPPSAPAVYRPNQYVIGALGGRGVTAALWAGEQLARAIHGESDGLQALHPLRFWVRALRRGVRPT